MNEDAKEEIKVKLGNSKKTFAEKTKGNSTGKKD